MTDILTKLAEAAAQANGPAQQSGQEGASAEEEGMVEQPMDPIELDNQKLTNILQNLQLRQQVMEAQKALEEAERPVSRRRSAKDPDKPRKTSRSKKVDISTASAMSDLVKNAPKSKRRMELSNATDNERLTEANSRTRNNAAEETPAPYAGGDHRS